MTSVAERMKKFQSSSSGSGSSLGGIPKCGTCHKSVYTADPQITLDGSCFHKACAKCQDCRCQITLGNFCLVNETLLCKTHYFKRFHEEGEYMGGDKFLKTSKSNDSTGTSSVRA